MTEAEKPLNQNAAGSTADAARHYVNHIGLNFTLSEVRIDFGQAFADSDHIRQQCRLVTSPVHLRRMGQEICATISHYETRFGSIPSDEGSAVALGTEGKGDG